MFTTCIVCNHQLGHNESLEHFPVGERLAFDPEKGRLWVICPQCTRWNLSPLEERWEAIEDAERLFRGTRLRVSTDNIGLARMRDGTDLVRIGQPQRPEMAAWRYGTQFTERRKLLIAQGAVAVAVLGVAALVSPILAPILGATGAVVLGVGKLTGSNALFARRFVRDNSGFYLLIPQDNIGWARLVGDGDQWGIKIPYADRRETITPRITDLINKGARGEVTVHGDAALDAARTLLPLINSSGANARVVRNAVSLVAEWKDTASGFGWAATQTHEWARHQQFGDTGSLSFLPREVRLALEMSAFEDQERRALEGELADLERAWRDAEEVAAISDDLLIPGPIRRALHRLRGTTPP